MRGIQHGNASPISMSPRTSGDVVPDRIYVDAPGMDRNECMRHARRARNLARSLAPKLSGRMAEGIETYAGDGYFGIRFDTAYGWYQERGIRGFTMRSLAGKTIPMWVDDLDGQMSRDNPKAETRVTMSGKRQIKIFRKAAPLGSRKNVAVRDGQGRLIRWRNVPRAYPGSPGRINKRQWSADGRPIGDIAKTNIGVSWHHPGLVGREFMQYAVQSAASEAGIEDLRVYATYKRR